MTALHQAPAGAPESSSFLAATQKTNPAKRGPGGSHSFIDRFLGFPSNYRVRMKALQLITLPVTLIALYKLATTELAFQKEKNVVSTAYTSLAVFLKG